jgi:hypothetical protein
MDGGWSFFVAEFDPATQEIVWFGFNGPYGSLNPHPE